MREAILNVNVKAKVQVRTRGAWISEGLWFNASFVVLRFWDFCSSFTAYCFFFFCEGDRGLGFLDCGV